MPAEQDVPLNIPKKTRLYVEQMDRERQSAVHMHRTFQRDLCRLRLKTGYQCVWDSHAQRCVHGSVCVCVCVVLLVQPGRM